MNWRITHGKPAPDERLRDPNGEISSKHGNILIGTLRKVYGPEFGKGTGERERLGDAIDRLDEQSLSQLVRDQNGSVL